MHEKCIIMTSHAASSRLNQDGSCDTKDWSRDTRDRSRDTKDASRDTRQGESEPAFLHKICNCKCLLFLGACVECVNKYIFNALYCVCPNNLYPIIAVDSTSTARVLTICIPLLL